MGVNSLPKIVTRQRRDYDLNLGPSAPESSTLTTRLYGQSNHVYLKRTTMGIPLVLFDSPALISSLLRLSAHHLALAASALQPLKSGTLSLYLSVLVPVLIPSVVTSRPTTASMPSNPRNPSHLAPQIRLLLTTVRIYKLYLLTSLAA